MNYKPGILLHVCSMSKPYLRLQVGPHTTSHTTNRFITEPHKGKKITNIQTREFALCFPFLVLSWTVRMLE